MPRRHTYRVPKNTPGKLTITYAIAEPWDQPDLIFTGLRSDGHLLNYIMGSKRPGTEFKNGRMQHVTEPSLFEELASRGYDLKTLKFEIWKTGMKPTRKKSPPKPKIVQPAMPEAMDIDSPKGTKVVYTGKNGTDADKKYADKFLIIGKVYTVNRTDIGGWSTGVYLEEHPAHEFNSSHFVTAKSYLLAMSPKNDG